MKQLKAYFQKDLFCLFLSAVLCALPLTFPALFLLSWFGFVPFFTVLLRRANQGKIRHALGRGVLFGFVYHALVYYWFLWLYPLDFAGFGNAASLGIVLFAWLGISLLHGALYAVPTLLCHLLSKFTEKKALLLLAAVFGILLAEWIPSLSQLAFPWVRLSLGHYKVPCMIQLASVFGIYGVDLLLLIFSALITLVFFSREKKKQLALLFVSLFLFSANLGFGLIRLSFSEKGEEITASAVQGCILSGEKWSGMGALDTYTSLTEKISDCDLIVWPESAVPVNLSTNPALLEEFQALSAKLDTPILMGCFWKIDSDTSNSAVLITSDSVSEVYSKRHLVPFGEKMPYRAVLSVLFPFLEEINMLSSDLASGTDSAVIEGEKGKIGSIICFESLFPQLTRASVRDGAELVVLVTNDSWYEDSPAVWQHLSHAVFRSVENSRCTVRAANSGVSAMIDSRGRLKSLLGPLEKGVVTDCVYFSEEETLFTRLGETVLPTVAVLWLCATLVTLFLERRKRNARSQ